MRENITQIFSRYRRAFGEFTNGQKAVAVVGGAALLLAAFLIFRWVAAPSYAPLYTNLTSSDASSVIDELNAEGVKYQLADNGTTIMVPNKDVYGERITLAGKNLPAGNSNSDGYGILDKESLATSNFQEQTDFKRAMEGELSKTLESMAGVKTAIVTLAMPEKQVFSDEQDPTTASVLIDTDPNSPLSSDQVQSIVHLVAASIDGLTPANVTVADSSGNLLNAPTDGTGLTGLTNDQQDQTAARETADEQKVQKQLDLILGPGNSQVAITDVLNFDQSKTTTNSIQSTPGAPPITASSASASYSGTNVSGNGVGGVVGPDGQMEPGTGINGTGGNVTSSSNSGTQQNSVTQTQTDTTVAPGALKSQHVSVVLDSAALAAAANSANSTNGPVSPQTIQQQVSAALGIDPTRGDTLSVSAIPFSHAAQQAAAAALAAEDAKSKHDAQVRLYRDIGLGAVVLLMVLLAWIKARRRSRAREQATSYVVEQLRSDAAARQAAIEAAQVAVGISPQIDPVQEALEMKQTQEAKEREQLRAQFNEFAESSPEDVASLLRGWLADRP